MTVSEYIGAALLELGRLGVRANGFLADEEGIPGVVVVGSETVFKGAPSNFETEQDALDWACVVATIERGVTA